MCSLSRQSLVLQGLLTLSAQAAQHVIGYDFAAGYGLHTQIMAETPCAQEPASMGNHCSIIGTQQGAGNISLASPALHELFNSLTQQ